MGNLNAQAFGDAVAMGDVDLRAALSWHLRANHYPPLPEAYVEVAEQAIDAANEGRWDDFLSLPQAVLDSGVVPRAAIEDDGHTVITVATAVEIMHLNGFLDLGEDDYYNVEH